MRFILACLVVGAAAGVPFTYRRSQELRDELNLLDLQDATGPSAGNVPSEGLLSDLRANPLATGATAAAQGPKPSESMPAPTSTGPGARGAQVSGQVAISGYSEKSFVAEAQVAFRSALASVIDIEEGLVKVVGVDADVDAGVSLSKLVNGKDKAKTPETISFPDAPASAVKPTVFIHLRGDVDESSCRVDYSAAVDAGMGKSAATKIEASITSGRFLKKFVELGAAKAKAVRVTEKPRTSGGAAVKDSTVAEREAASTGEKRWRPGAGHWDWIHKAHLPNRGV